MKTISILLLATLAIFELGCGYGSMATTPAVAGVVPAIAQLSPNTATHSGAAAALTLTVNGSNFSSSSVVNWNATALTTTFVTANQVTATVPGSALATAAVVPVSVTNPGVAGGIYGGGTLTETSNTMNFTIN